MAEISGGGTEALGSRLGKLALDQGLITPEQLRDALAEQARESAQGTTRRLVFILVEKGYLTPQQINALIEKGKRELSQRAEPVAAPPSTPDPSPSGEAKPSPAGSFQPSKIGKFLIKSELGRGGMGVVYEAHDDDLDRRVALKMIVPSPNADPKEAALDEERFLREARLSAKLKHPHVVTVYEAGTIEGRRYIAMEFIQGRPLSLWRKGGSVTIRQQIVLLRDVALAVHHAHELGIIHRDLKPANILVDAKNEPHVTDFGLAKLVGQNVTLSFTEEGRVVGTPSYMSPEQVEGLKNVDRRTDIYSLGVMLYEIVAGRLPFEGQTAAEIMVKVIKDPVRPPSKITVFQMNPFLYTSLEKVCLKAMAKDPRHRYPTSAALAEDLTKWLKGEEVRASLPRLRRYRPWIRPGAAAAIFLILGGIAGWLFGTSRGRAPQAFVEGASMLPSEEAWKRATNLLPLIDPARDAVGGSWALLDGKLISDASQCARIEIPYEPPEEYDVRMVFSRLSGRWDVNLVLSKSGRAFVWLMGAFENTVFGFEFIRGAWSNANPTTRLSPGCLENGRTHTSVVQVRKDGLKAYLDGRLITEYKTDYSDLSIGEPRALRDSHLLGLGSFQSPSAFHRVEILEVTGKGRRSRTP